MKPNSDLPSREHLEELLLESRTRCFSSTERGELNAILRTEETARTVAAQTLMDDAALAEVLRTVQLESLLAADSGGMLGAAQRSPAFTRRTWLSWRPLTAAAAGIVFGILCTSVVFGFGLRLVEKVVSLMQENFESAPAPLVTGVPPGPGLWSGDYSEVVGEVEGVNPKDGSKMVRLLRSDFESRTAPRPSRQGDLMRVLDVQPLLTDAKGGDVVMTLSAQFNAAPFPDSERYDGMVTVYALGADTNHHDATEDSIKEDALAFSIGECRNLDRDAGTWQATSTRLLLPPGTESVMVMVSFRRTPAGTETLSSLPESLTFAGHSVDDVRASISIREAVHDHRTQRLR